MGLLFERLKYHILTTREVNIISHYEREMIKGHMTLNTAYERACADIAGANGHPTKAQRSLKEGSQ